jgi:nucleotide-binding universal stress UspA family protein
MFRKLLVPLDRSPFAEQAIVEAGEIARRSSAAIRLLLVHQPVPYAGFEDVPWFAELADAESEYLSTMAAGLQVHDIPVTTALLKGDPAERICEEAIESESDVIVMSTHGRTGFSRMWMGSVAHNVVRHSGLPVILVRPGSEGSQVAETSAEIRRILVTLDDSTIAREILPAATELARCHGASMLVLRVVSPVSWVPPMTNMPFAASPPLYDEALTQNLIGSAEKDMEMVKKQLENAIGDVTTKVIVDVSVAHAILKFADDHHVDLIAMSTHGRGASRLFLGSVADKVLRGAHTPMLLQCPSSIRTDGFVVDAAHAAGVTAG